MPHFIFFTDLMLNYLGGTERGIFLYSVCLKHLLSFILFWGFFVFLFFDFCFFMAFIMVDVFFSLIA